MIADAFSSLIEISITTAAVILALLLLSSSLNKAYAAKWKYWIWLILAIRLILPFNFSLPNTIVELSLPKVSIKIPQLDNFEPIQTASDVETIEHTIPFVQIGMLIWMAGFLVFMLHQLIGYSFFKKQVLRWSHPVRNSIILKVFQRLLAEMNIRKRIVLLMSERVACPMIIGFAKPILFLPCADYTDTELYFILKHELVHFRRHDIWYKLLLLLANAAHWFNPLVYLMREEASKDIELSCDDEVTEGLSFNDRKQYSETILTSIHNEQTRQTALSTYFNGGRKIMKERFKNIFSVEKKHTGKIAFLVVLVSMIIVGGLVACSTQNTDTGASDTLLSPTPTSDSTIASAPEPTVDDTVTSGVSPQPNKGNDFLETPDGIEFRTVSQKFAEAFFSANEDDMKDYLIEPNTKITTHEKGNVLNDLEYLTLKWSPASMGNNGIVIASYESILKGEDSVTYLTLEMKKVDSEWKVAFYALEK